MEEKRKAGAPAKILTPKQIAEFDNLAAGMTIAQLADYFGMGESTFKAYKRKNIDINNAYKKYKAKGISEAFGVLWDIIMSKSPQSLTAVMFYLKTQGGYREKQDMEIAVGENVAGKLILEFADNKKKTPKKENTVDK